MLGLPALFDHLFDLRPLPAVARGRGRDLRARSEAATADRPRASRLLDGRTGPGGAPGDRLDDPRHAVRRRGGLSLYGEGEGESVGGGGVSVGGAVGGGVGFGVGGGVGTGVGVGVGVGVGSGVGVGDADGSGPFETT